MSDDPFDARRRVERRPVALDTIAKGANGLAQPMTLLNLSPLGLHARGAGSLVPGDYLRLDLSPGFGALAKVVWISGEEFGGTFHSYAPLDGLAAADPERLAAEAGSRPAGEEHSFRIEYGPPGDRRTVHCPNARNATDWHDEIVSAGLPFVRILNVDGDVVSAAFLRKLIAG